MTLATLSIGVMVFQTLRNQICGRDFRDLSQGFQTPMGILMTLVTSTKLCFIEDLVLIGWEFKAVLQLPCTCSIQIGLWVSFILMDISICH